MTSNAICHNPNSTWTLNTIGQDPCVQYAVLVASYFIVTPMNATSPPYIPSIRTAACACNVVAYSLASACSWCQGTVEQPTHWVTQAEWGRNCTTLGQIYLPDGLPRTSRPPSVVIPHWAYVPPSSGIWDSGQAQVVANTSAITFTTSIPTVHPASTTTPSPVPSIHNPGTIFEDNKHLPAIITILLVLVICLMGILVAAVRKMIKYCRRRPRPEPVLPDIVSQVNPSLTRVSYTPPTALGLDLTTLHGFPRPPPIHASSPMTTPSSATSHALPSLQEGTEDEATRLKPRIGAH
ncbi:hypothetical protein M408DRAFT_24701 [Serendipita vermifera MAFF 305830]|uniref:Uncharacterized protein n=1 Tax=Serendipita vermifera MAFF 305830 TaxID=933852 RepID=A0A0C3B4W6_SERVB|nr:hypothetical protein M408DRAFT_24701 [Serendipita vermifera MAFF 305830]